MSFSTPIFHTAAGGTSAGATTGAQNSTGSDGIRLLVNHFTGGTYPTISDTKGNTYTKVVDQLGGTGNVYNTAWWYCDAPVVGTGHTFSALGTGSFATIAAIGFSGGASSSSLDQHSGAGTGTNGNVVTPGSVTPGQDNELILTGVLFNQSSQTVGVDSGFTLTDQGAPTSGFNFGIAIAYKIQTTATAVNPTWTATSATDGMAAVTATFKAAGSGNVDADFSLTQTLAATDAATGAAVASTSFTTALAASDTSVSSAVAATALSKILAVTDTAVGASVGTLTVSVTPGMSPSGTGQSVVSMSFAETLDLSAVGAVTFFADFALAITSVLAASGIGGASATITLTKTPGISDTATGQAAAALALAETLALSALATLAASAGLTLSLVSYFTVSGIAGTPTGTQKFLTLKIDEGKYLKLVIG